MSLVKRRIDFGMSIAPARSLHRPLSEKKIAALRRATEAARGKAPRGERNAASKLTDAQVRKIRALRASGERPSVLALRFCVDRTLIWHIVKRNVWTHV